MSRAKRLSERQRLVLGLLNLFRQSRGDGVHWSGIAHEVRSKTGRDPKRLQQTLDVLEERKLIVTDGMTYWITAEGRRAMRAAKSVGG